MGFFNRIISKIKSAARKKFIVNEETNSVQILLNSEDEQYFTLTFDAMNIKNPNDHNIFRSYAINAFNQDLGDLYIESIEVDSLNNWNVSAGSSFDNFIKNEFHKSNFEFIKSYDDDFCNFKKYLVDDKYEIALIWLSLSNQELFIFDEKGKLYNDLLKIYDVENKAYFIENFELGNFKVKNTLTQSNMIENYIGSTS